MSRSGQSPILPEAGALCRNGSTRFRVWAPGARTVEIRLVDEDRLVPMRKERGGYWVAEEPVGPGTLYRFRLNGSLERPDPASRHQPQGVHGPSAVVSSDFDWNDSGWRGIPIEQYRLYELHAGTFHPHGNFSGVEQRLPELSRLGINAIELMPVSAFPGARNWGYDGAYPFAVQHSYGGPDGLKRLAGACHTKGMALVLDVVYNHMGPEGCYLRDFGPYFSRKHRTPWGEGLNFDGRGSRAVRDFFLASAVRWIEEFHVDALRLDATDTITDRSARHFLVELGEHVHAAGRRRGWPAYLFAEHGPLDPRVILPREDGGYGLDAMWNDDFHHALRALLTGDRAGYLRDFGDFSQLADVFEQGYYRRTRFAAEASRTPFLNRHLVAFSHNHDQVANRAGGRRLAPLIGWQPAALAAAAVILGPFLPMLFMGEEYGDPAPFLFFTDFGDPDLARAVHEGRAQEYAAFFAGSKVPDPQAPRTFEQSCLDWGRAGKGAGSRLRSLYRRLLGLRKAAPDLYGLKIDRQAQVVRIERAGEGKRVRLALNFSEEPSIEEIAAGWPLAIWAPFSSVKMPKPGAPASLPGRSFAVWTSGKGPLR